MTARKGSAVLDAAGLSRTFVGTTLVCRDCGADYSHPGGATLHALSTGHDFRSVYRVRHCHACEAIVYVRRPHAVTLYASARAAAGFTS